MARNYGNDRNASATIRLTTREKEILQAIAEWRDTSISQVIRDAILYYCEEMASKEIYQRALQQKSLEASIERFKAFAEQHNSKGDKE